MGLHKEDRYLFSVWEGGKKSLPNDLSQVALVANATNGQEGYLSLEYSFSNKNICDEEIKEHNDAGL